MMITTTMTTSCMDELADVLADVLDLLTPETRQRYEEWQRLSPEMREARLAANPAVAHHDAAVRDQLQRRRLRAHGGR